MSVFILNITNFDASVANTPILAINNPAGSGVRILVQCVQNSHTDKITIATYRLERFAALATGGTALALEPGDTTPRVCRRDATDSPPALVALTGAFTPPTSPLCDESFTVISREGAASACYDIDGGPLVINAGECAVLTLLGADADSTSVSVDVAEHDEVPLMHSDLSVITRLDGELFDATGALSAERWAITPTGSGTATQSGGSLALATGITADSAIVIEAVRHARFMSDETHDFEAWVRISDAGSANNVRRWGPLLATDGFYFEISGTTLGVGVRKASANTSVAAALWDRRGFTLDANYHHYMIRYNGNAVEYFIDEVMVHRLFGQTAPLVSTLDLAIRFENTNSGGLDSDLAIHVRDAAIGRHAQQSGAYRTVHYVAGSISTLVKAGAGTLGCISITGAGVGGGTVTLYDSLSASGTILGHYETGTVGQFRRNVDFSTGLYILKNANSPPVDIDFD